MGSSKIREGVTELSHGVTGRWKFFEMPKDPVTVGPEKHDCLLQENFVFRARGQKYMDT